MLISLQRVHQLDFNNEIFISRMHGANIKRIQRNFRAGKLRHARTADNPAVTTVPPVKVNVNARQLILYLSPHKLLGKPLPLSLSRTTQLAHKLQTANRCEIQFLKSQDRAKVREFDRRALIRNLQFRNIHIHSSDTLSLSVVSKADKLLHLPPLHIKCTQQLGHKDGSRSGVKMFLRVVILVFAATCCTARVIGKALHTRH
jgi:hypothetical protein